MNNRTYNSYLYTNKNEDFVMYAKCKKCKNYFKDIMVFKEARITEIPYCKLCNEILKEVEFPVDISKMWSDNIKANLAHYKKNGLL